MKTLSRNKVHINYDTLPSPSHPPVKGRLGGGGLRSRLESVGKTTLSASLSILVPSHENTGTTSRGGA